MPIGGHFRLNQRREKVFFLRAQDGWMVSRKKDFFYVSCCLLNGQVLLFKGRMGSTLKSVRLVLKSNRSAVRSQMVNGEGKNYLAFLEMKQKKINKDT